MAGNAGNSAQGPIPVVRDPETMTSPAQKLCFIRRVPMSNKLLVSSFAFSTLLVLASGCSSKHMATADASDGDGPVPCGGHGQPACPTDAQDADYLSHYGGEIRMEYAVAAN